MEKSVKVFLLNSHILNNGKLSQGFLLNVLISQNDVKVSQGFQLIYTLV